MKIPIYIDVSLVVLGFILAGIGSLFGARWNENFPFVEPGPYANTVGIAGAIIFVIGACMGKYRE